MGKAELNVGSERNSLDTRSAQLLTGEKATVLVQLMRCEPVLLLAQGGR